MMVRLGSLLVRIGVTLALGYVAVGAYRQAVIDWEYQLVGLADPFLGHPAPGWTIGIGAIASGILAVAWLTIRAVATRSAAGAGPPPAESGAPVVAQREEVEQPGPSGRFRFRWWWILAAAWGGYAAGSVITVAAGGPVDHPGTMRLTFGAPIGTTVEVAATCRSAPGKSGVVAEVIPDPAGLPSVGLRNPATGERLPWPAPTGVSLRVDYRGGDAFVVPGLPDRVPMYGIGMGIDGPIAGPTIHFVEAYYYNAMEGDDRGTAGTVSVQATRTHALFQVANDLIPDDPWPETYELGIAWTCDLAATMAAASPAATPSPVFTVRPSPSVSHVEPDGVPVELRIVTSSDWTTVRLDGATIVRSPRLAVEGGAIDAVREGPVFRLTQSVADASSGNVVGVTFAVVLADLTSGSTLSVSIRQGSLGIAAVTFSNDLGDDPVPVLVIGSQPQPVATPPPIELSAKWLVLPVSPAVVR